MLIKKFKPIKQKIGKVLKVSKVQVKTIPVKIQWLYNNLRGKSGTLQRKVFKVALFAVLPTVIGGILIYCNPELQILLSKALSKAKNSLRPVNLDTSESSTHMNPNKNDFDLAEAAFLLFSSMMAIWLFVGQLQAGFGETPISESPEKNSSYGDLIMQLIEKYYAKLPSVVGDALIYVFGSIGVGYGLQGLAGLVDVIGHVTNFIISLFK